MTNRKESAYYDYKDVMEIVGVGRVKAYSIIKNLNEELEKKNTVTIAGKIPKDYFHERLGLK